jgi:hypothetical protein
MHGILKLHMDQHIEKISLIKHSILAEMAEPIKFSSMDLGPPLKDKSPTTNSNTSSKHYEYFLKKLDTRLVEIKHAISPP